MAEPDLSQLRIERGALHASRGTQRGRRAARWIAAIVAVAAVAGLAYTLRPAPQVELATASLVYPSRAQTVLNATGYGVAQRKAAVAS